MVNYLNSRAGRRGWFFQRSVPPDCRDAIGKATWIRKAGDNLLEAKRNAAVFLEASEQLIREGRGKELSLDQKLVSLPPQREDIPKDFNVNDLMSEVRREPMFLDSKGTVNPRHDELHELAQDVIRGTARPINKV